MPIIPIPERLGPGSAVQSAVRSIDLATGNAVSQAGRVFGIGGNDGQVAGTPQQSEAPVQRVSGAVGGRARYPVTPDNDLPQWGNLSRHLIARIYPCDSQGRETQQGARVLEVRGPITESNFEATLNWQSPFENTGPESKAPALMAMLQTGQIATIANALQAVVPEDFTVGGMRVGELLSGAAENTAEWARELEGSTGVTKLNSRQVFAGMPPIRLTMTMHFRAMSDAQSEVMAPYQQLLSWAFPKKLAADGILAGLIRGDSKSLIKALFPSDAPQLVGFTYANNRYTPMVIEQVGNPIDGPIGADGLPIYRAVQLTLATLTALDKNDVPRLFSRSGS